MMRHGFGLLRKLQKPKYKHDARKLFEMGEKLMGKKPKTLITDGLSAYHDAYKKEFWTLKHIQEPNTLTHQAQR